MGDVIKFPESKPRICSNCKFGMLGSGGTYCSFFAEFVWDEYEADDCEAYEE